MVINILSYAVEDLVLLARIVIFSLVTDSWMMIVDLIEIDRCSISFATWTSLLHYYLKGIYARCNEPNVLLHGIASLTRWEIKKVSSAKSKCVRIDGMLHSSPKRQSYEIHKPFTIDNTITKTSLFLHHTSEQGVIRTHLTFKLQISNAMLSLGDLLWMALRCS